MLCIKYRPINYSNTYFYVKIADKSLEKSVLIHKHLFLSFNHSLQLSAEDSRNRTLPKITSAPIHRTLNLASSDDWDIQIDREQPYVIPGLTDQTEESDEKFKTNIEIQCMKPSERKKYYKLMVEKAKEKLSEQDQNSRSLSLYLL